MADVKLTKYIDGAGIQALYKKIRAKVTGSDAAVTGNWSADKANNIKITENSGKYWNVTDNTLYLSGYQALNNNYASLISTKRTYITTLATGLGADSFKDTLHVDAISLGGESTDVLLGNGSSKAISELEVKSATSATQIKSELATSPANPTYYLLGSKSSTADTSTPLKHANVSVTVGGDSKAILSADGFNGPLKIATYAAGGSANTTQYPLLTKNGSINANGDSYITPEAFGSVYITKQEEREVIVAPKFVGALDGNAKTATDATNATNAAKVNITNKDNESIYLLGSKDTGYADVYRNSNIYVSGNQLFLPVKPTEDNAAATKKYVDDAVKNFDTLNQVLKFKGSIDSESGDRLLSTSSVGDTYVVAAAGTYAGEVCEVGDMIICTASTQQANGEWKATAWTVIQRNIPGVLTTQDITDLLAEADGQSNA